MLRKRFISVSIVLAAVCGLILSGCTKKQDNQTEKPKEAASSCLRKAQLLVKLPDYCNTPDGMALLADNSFVLSVPNYNDANDGAVIMKISADNKVSKFFDPPVHRETKVAAPMGICVAPSGDLYYADNQFSQSPETPVPRHRRHLAQRIELMLHRNKFARILLILRNSFLIRVNDYDTAIPIDDYGIAAANIFRKILQRHHSRNTERTSDNRRMRRSPARIAGYAFDVFPVKAGCLRRAKLSGDDNNLFGQIRNFLALPAQQLLEHTLLDIVDIRRPLADIYILNLREMRCDITQNRTRRILGRNKLRPNQIGYTPHKALIPKKSQMNRENILDFTTRGIALRIRKMPQLLHCGGKSILDTLNLSHTLMRLDRTPRNPIVLRINDQRLSYGYAMRDGNAFFYFHNSLSS